ncbi:hypothetical protein HGRIS_009460 [Hohenbuehelia grisea]|uniref:Uncharacterized protein n=1 Tax=Hohenbuehelia grisea TaxID=104357 RepID=A0ABR3J1B6_9AGAR
MDDSDDQEEGAPRFSLAHFAYNGNATRPLLHRNLSSRTSSSSSIVSIPPPPPVPKKLSRTWSKTRFASRVSDAQLAKLLKCVSCDTKWTARKSAAQKASHVQSCAKKRGFSEDTVCVLIERELAKAAAEETEPAAPKNKGKGKAVEAAPKPVTFFEELVNEAGVQRKKPGPKRAKVSVTVQSVVETRDDILKKARAAFGAQAKGTESIGIHDITADLGHSGVAERYAPARTLLGDLWDDDTSKAGPSTLPSQPIDDDIHGRGSIPATQAFAPSKFGARTESMFDEDDDATDIEGSHFPATQAFAPSRLGTGARPMSLLAGLDASDNEPKDIRLGREGASSSSNFAPSKFASRKKSLFDSDGEEFGLEPAQPILVRDPSQMHLYIAYNGQAPRAPAFSSEILRRLDAAMLRVNEGAITKPAAKTPKAKTKASKAAARSPPDDILRSPFNGDAGPSAWDDDVLYRHDDDNDNFYGEALMHFEPSVNHSPTDTPAAKTKSPRKTKSKSPSKRSVIDETPLAAGSLTKEPAPRSKTKSTKKSKGKDESNAADQQHLSSDEWLEDIKQRIMQDEQLHLRILRYEPIHFDEFLKLIPDKPTGALKLELRAVLDKLVCKPLSRWHLALDLSVSSRQSTSMGQTQRVDVVNSSVELVLKELCLIL